jgi:hypothetical protein
VIGSASGDARADSFPDMSKSKPTRVNVPYYNGTCKSFFLGFFGWAVIVRTNRKNGWLGALEDIDGKGFLKESGNGVSQHPDNNEAKQSANSTKER